MVNIIESGSSSLVSVSEQGHGAVFLVKKVTLRGVHVKVLVSGNTRLFSYFWHFRGPVSRKPGLYFINSVQVLSKI